MDRASSVEPSHTRIDDILCGGFLGASTVKGSSEATWTVHLAGIRALVPIPLPRARRVRASQERNRRRDSTSSPGTYG